MEYKRILYGLEGLGWHALSVLTGWGSLQSRQYIVQGREARENFEEVNDMLTNLISGVESLDNLAQFDSELAVLDDISRNIQIDEYREHIGLLATMYDGREDEDVIVRQELIAIRDSIDDYGQKWTKTRIDYGYMGMAIGIIATLFVMNHAAKQYYKAFKNLIKPSQEEPNTISDTSS